MGSGIPEPTESVPARLADAAKDALAEVSDKVSEVTNPIESSVRQISGVAGGASDQLGVKARASLARGRDAVGHWIHELAESVQQRPVTAVCIAAAVGFVFGMSSTSQRD